MANPKGNTKTLKSFKPQGQKALKGHLAVKVDQADWDKFKKLDNWRELIRPLLRRIAIATKEPANQKGQD